MRRFELTKEQFASIAHLLPGRPGTSGRKGDNHMFMNAVIHLLMTGEPWRNLPKRYGNWNSNYQRYARWYKKGVWPKVQKVLKPDANDETLRFDSLIVRAEKPVKAKKK